LRNDEPIFMQEEVVRANPQGTGSLHDPIDLTRSPPIDVIDIDGPPMEDEDTIMPDDVSTDSSNGTDASPEATNDMIMVLATETADNITRHAPAA
jgi:hypothetical protein